MSDPDAATIGGLLEAHGDGLRLGDTGVEVLDALPGGLGLDRLSIDGAKIQAAQPSGDGEVLVIGRTRLLDIGAEATAVLRILGEEAELRLEFDLPQTIADLFGPQPPSTVADEDGYLVDVASTLAGLVIQNPVFTTSNKQAGGTFTGDLAVDQAQASHSLAPYTPVPISASVTLAGTYTQQLTGRGFTLYGPSLASVALPGFIAEYGLCLSNEQSPDDPQSSASFYLRTDRTLKDAELLVPLLSNDAFWSGLVSWETPFTLDDGISSLAALLGRDSGELLTPPDGVDLFSSFGLRALQLGFDPGAPGEAPSLRQVAATITSTASWSPPVPLIDQVGPLGASFLYVHGDGDVPDMMTGTVFGDLKLGDPSGQQLSLRCSASLPIFDVEIRQLDGEAVNFAAFLQNVLPGTSLPDGWGGVTVSDFSALGMMREREFHAAMTLADPTGQLKLGPFALTQLSARIDISQSTPGGSIAAVLTVPNADPAKALDFFISAAYASAAGGWTFSGGLVYGDALEIADLVQAFGVSPPQWLADMHLAIEGLWFSYSTGDGAYSVTGKIRGDVSLQDALGVDLQFAVGAEVSSAGGSLSGGFSIGDVAVLGTLAFAEPKAWTFKVIWDGVTFDASTVAVKDDDGGGTHNVIRISSFGGMTLGQIVTRMIAMIDPNLDVTLDPPWDALTDIDLSLARFSIDPKYSRLSVEIDVGLDVGFGSFSKVGLVYDRNSPDGSVRYQLWGSFLGQSYRDQPITWDAINESPPTIPGAGTSLLDLHYLGVGQHIGLPPHDPTIDGVLTAMQDVIRPADGRSNPIPAGHFSAEMGWLAGLDITLMGFIGLKVVFADPAIYGLHVELSGEQAEALDGLAIDLTYRKITRDVGVFHAQLKLPDAYRQIEMGAVLVTLGIVAVDVYTDGGFEIDLGFPRGGDFSRAFTAEATPFLGRGGLYFGVLQSGGSSRIPIASNGDFKPGVELGIGFAGGIGREFHKGPLSAGVYVELEGIFEGALAWFHPDDSAQPVDTYYYCRATVALAGMLYGSIDFGIISVGVTVAARASATAVFEAYRATHIDLDVSVSAEAEVHFLFFSVSFSFGIELEVTFVIGSDGNAPWILTSDPNADQRIDRIHARPRRSARRALDQLHRHHLLRSGGDAPRLNWRGGDVVIFPGGVRTVSATITASLTLDAPAVEWTQRPYPVPYPPPSHLMAFVVASLPPEGASDGDSLDIAVEAMLRWALSAASQLGQDDVDVGALVDLDEQMRSADTAKAFSFDALSSLFSRNLTFTFHNFTSATAASGTVMPMPPVFARTDGPGPDPSVDYWTQTPITPTYERELGDWIANLAPVDPPPNPARLQVVQKDDDSFPRMTFRSYFLMMAKAIVGEAKAIAGAWGATLPAGAALAALARTFKPLDRSYVKTAGDTAQTLAAQFGLSVEELVFLAPDLVARFDGMPAGTVVQVPVGVTPQSIAAGNPGLALAVDPASPVAPTVRCDLAPLPWHTRPGDTLEAIAGDSMAAWLQAEGAGAISGDSSLLLAGARLDLASYFWGAGAPLDDYQRSARLFVRLIDIDPTKSLVQPDLVAWCATRILQLNPGLVFDSSGAPIDPPQPLMVPTDRGDGAGPWQLSPGDTLSRISRAVALVIWSSAGLGYMDFHTRLFLANQPPVHPVVLPDGTSTAILADETLATLAGRLMLDLGDPVFADILRKAAVLAPMRVLTPPQSLRDIPLGATLQNIADTYGLSLEDVGTRLANLAAFAPDAQVTIAHAPLLPTEELIRRAIVQGGPRVRAQLSRYMMQGLRVPVPDPVGGGLGSDLAALATLNGQQAPLGQFAISGDPAYAYKAAFSFEQARQVWIAFAEGQEVVTGLSAADVADHTPAPVIYPAFYNRLLPITAVPLTILAPQRWDLAQRLLWMTPAWPTDVLGPDPGGGALPSLWPLPETLLAACRAQPEMTDITLQLIDVQAPPGTEPTTPNSFCFATRLDVEIRLSGAPRVYEVMAVDSAQRDLLLDLWQAAIQNPEYHPFEVFLAYQSPGGAGPMGLATPAAGQSTVILQTNLSTESRDMLSAPASFPNAAPIGDPGNFLRLVWEAGMVGGGGYWLRVGEGDAQGLPSAIFDQSGRATLSLLALQKDQWGYNHVFDPRLHNYVAIGDPIAPATTHAFLGNADYRFDRALPQLGPGQVAFESARAQPIGAPRRLDGGGVAMDPQVQVQQLFQLLAYRVGEFGGFRPSEASLPIWPQATGEGSAARWTYRQVVPLSRFSLERTVPSVAGLPAPDDDPYAAIYGELEPAWARLEFWFQDIFGNATLDAPRDRLGPSGPGSSEDLYAFSLSSMYTDPVPGLNQWPSTASTFQVAGAAGAARLEVQVELQLSAYSPAPSQLASDLAKTALRHRDQFGLIWCQLFRPDFTATLASNLFPSPEGGGPPQPIPLELEPLRAFVGGAYVYLSSVARLVDETAAASCATIGAICTTYGVDYGDLAGANGGLLLGPLFQACRIPVFVNAAQGRTMTDLCGSAEAAAAALALPANATLPLTAGVELWIPPKTVTVSDKLTLAALAASCGCSVDSLALASAALPCLAPGVTLTSGTQSVVTGQQASGPAISSLADAVAALVAAGAPTTVLGLARASADLAGLIAPGASLSVDGYLVKAGETLAANASGVSQADLAPLNTGVADLYPAGTPVFVTDEAATAADLALPLASVAAVHGVSVEQLLSYWSATPLLTPAAFALPGRVVAPPSPATALIAPYTVRADDLLDTIAGRFMGATALSIATANWGMPATLLPAIQMVIGGIMAMTEPGDSLGAFAGRFGPTVSQEQFVEAIRGFSILKPGALLLCPPAATGQAASLTALAATYGLTPKSLGLANAGLAGWLVPTTVFKCRGATVPSNGQPGDLSNYSLAGVVAAFRQQGVATTVSELIDNNPDMPILAGAPFLLPPAVLGLVQPIAAGGAYPEAVFPIATTLTLARSEVLVEPTLNQPGGAVQQAVSQIAPKAAPPPGAIPGDPTLNFEAFAKALETALPQFRVCNGRIDPTAPGRAHLWIVAFASQLTAAIEASSVRRYALRPLYPQPVSRDGVRLLGRSGVADPPTDIRNADVEVWARAFLADVDAFLDAGHALAVHDAAPDALQKVLGTKPALAAAIAAGLDNLFEASPTPARDAARAKLKQQLLTSLDAGWATTLMLQYAVTTSAPAAQSNIRLPLIPLLKSGGGDPGAAVDVATLAGDAIGFQSPGSFLHLTAVVGESTETALDFGLSSAVKEVEFDIAEIDGTGGYERSAWLSFVRSPTADGPAAGWSIDLGAPKAPLLARSFPTSPQLIAQSTRHDPGGPAGWAGAPYWRLDIAFSYRAAPQDQIVFGALFNTPPSTQARTPDPGLFEALAGYQAVRASIWGDIDGGNLAKGAADFGDQVQRVTAAWQAHWPDPARDERMARLFRVGALHAGAPPAASAIGFLGTLIHDQGRYQTLVVEPYPDPNAPVAAWPDISIDIDGARHPLVPGEVANGRRPYAFPPGVDIAVGALISYQVSFGGLHAASRQEAVGAVAVVRNRALLGLDGPATVDDFVYRAPPTLFPVTAAPYLSFDAPFDAGPWASTGPGQLTAILATLLTDGGAVLDKVSIEARSGSDAISPVLPLRLPVFYNPKASYPGSAPLDQAIAEQIQAWAGTFQPPAGWWEIIVTAYATLTDRTDGPLMEVRLAFTR